MWPLANQEQASPPQLEPSPLAGDANMHSIKHKLTPACALIALLLPLKLSLTYIALVPTLLAWLYYERAELKRHLLSTQATAIYAPLLFFLITAAASSLAGLAPLRSLLSLSSLAFFTLTIPLFATQANPRQTTLALIAGQTIAALHSFIDASFPDTIPRLFLGKVTESSQLTLTIFIAAGAALSLGSGASFKGKQTIITAISILITVALTLIGFNHQANLSTSLTLVIAVAALACCLAGYPILRRASSEAKVNLLISLCCLPLLISALILNLKRGPWLGVLIGATALCLWYARRFIAPIVIGAVILATTVAPIRDRISDSYDHFTITGGRSTIWRIGLELASDYPLGIGYHNSGILRNFAPEIPPELKHFHNNLINIAAETGWLGLGIFLWLCLGIVRLAWRDSSNKLAVAIGCGVIAWQAAGLVEYNFGDSEVTILVWILLGLLLTNAHNDRAPA